MAAGLATGGAATATGVTVAVGFGNWRQRPPTGAPVAAGLATGVAAGLATGGAATATGATVAAGLATGVAQRPPLARRWRPVWQLAARRSTTARREPAAGAAIALAFPSQLATLRTAMSRGLSWFGWCIGSMVTMAPSGFAEARRVAPAPLAEQAMLARERAAGPVAERSGDERSSGSARGAARSKTLSPAAYRCSPGLTVGWEFRTASPVAAPPALTPEGRLFIATHEGYLHALNERGDFLWSYTVDGALLWGAQVDEQGRVYALSSAGTMYSLFPSGRPRSVYRFRRNPSAPPLLTSKGLLTAHGYNLYALAPGGGLRWRAFLGSEVSSGPWARADGSVWLTTRDGQLRRVRSPRAPSDVLELSDGARVVGANAAGAALVLEEGTLSAIDESGERLWQRDAMRAVSADGRVAVQDDQVVWLDPRTGAQEAEVPLQRTLAAAPAAQGDWAWLPTVEGELLAVHRQGAIESCHISAAPLMRPIVDAARERVIATTGDGVVAAVRHRETR